MNQLDDEVIILDAREKEEYSVSHIENSIFIGYQDFNISVLEGFSKDEKFVVYCSLGIRSARIGKILQKAGFENVQNLYGGIFEWKKKGYPVIDSQGNSTEKVHAYSREWSKWLKIAKKIY